MYKQQITKILILNSKGPGHNV